MTKSEKAQQERMGNFSFESESPEMNILKDNGVFNFKLKGIFPCNDRWKNFKGLDPDVIRGYLDPTYQIGILGEVIDGPHKGAIVAHRLQFGSHKKVVDMPQDWLDNPANDIDEKTGYAIELVERKEGKDIFVDRFRIFNSTGFAVCKDIANQFCKALDIPVGQSFMIDAVNDVPTGSLVDALIAKAKEGATFTATAYHDKIMVDGEDSGKSYANTKLKWFKTLAEGTTQQEEVIDEMAGT